MASASNSLAREFLTDVHHLCSEVAHLAEAQDEEVKEEEDKVHMVALGSYLMQGRGFLLLRTLDCVINQELNCREELLTLLLSLLPLVWKILVPEEKAPNFALPSLTKVLHHRGSATLFGSGGRKVISNKERCVKLTLGQQKSWRQRKASHRCLAGNGLKSQLSTSDSCSSSDDRATVPARRQWKSHGCSSVGGFLWQGTAAVRATTSEVGKPHVLGSDIQKYTGVVSVHDGHAWHPCSPFDLCHVVLSLLEKLCRFDADSNLSPSVVDRVVPVLLEMLTELAECQHRCEGGTLLAPGWTEEPVALIQRMLLHAILHLMSGVAGQGKPLPEHLCRNLLGLMVVMLKQPGFSVTQMKIGLQEAQKIFSSSTCWHQLMLLTELLEGVLHVQLGCWQASLVGDSPLCHAVQLIHEFVQLGGLELSGASVLHMESLCTEEHVAKREATERAQGLVCTIVKLISAIKRVIAQQQHQPTCTRRHHRHCEYPLLLTHHHDVSGFPMFGSRQPFREGPLEGSIGFYPKHCCVLATCAQQCLHLLPLLPSSSPAWLQILTGLRSAGVCCCMDPRSAVAPLLHTLRVLGPNGCRSHVLNVLSWLLLEQLGGNRLTKRTQQDSCSICFIDEHHQFLLDKHRWGRHARSEPSSLSTTPRPSSTSLETEDNVLCRWDALEAYQELVFHEDQQLGLATASHVCHLLLHGNAAVQLQLGIHVLIPVLQGGVALARYARELNISSSCGQASTCCYQGLSVDVLQVFLQILPRLLTFRVIRDLFLCCNGLQQLTELMYLHPVRLLALRVLETLILSADPWYSNQIKEGKELGTAVETADETGSCVHLEDTCNHKRLYESQPEIHPPEKDKGTDEGKLCPNDAHLNAINLFLSVVFICVSKEADSDKDSASDSEDTSGYDSTVSEPLGCQAPCLPPESVVLPAEDQLLHVADVWSMCCKIYLASPPFQSQFSRLGGFKICSRLITMVIEKLALKTWKGKTKKKREDKGEGNPSESHQSSQNTISCPEETNVRCLPNSPGSTQTGSKSKDQIEKMEEWPLHGLRLLEVLLTICLHNTKSFALQKMDSELSVQHALSAEDFLDELRKQFSLSGLVNSDLAAPFFDTLLRVALFKQSGLPDILTEKATRKMHCGETIGLESDLSDVMDKSQNTFALPVEEEGYEGDSESSHMDNSTQENGSTETSYLGQSLSEAMTESYSPLELHYPEVSSMMLHLLSTGSPELKVLFHILGGLVAVVHRNLNNAVLLCRQGAVKTILVGFHDILSQSDPSFRECQVALVEMLAAMASVNITAEELTLLFQLFLEKTPPTEILLRGILCITEANMEPEPLQFLSFPLPADPCTPRSLLLGLQQTGLASSKAAGLSLKSTVHTSHSGTDREMLGHHWTSPWNLAPIHLTLVGQNCWPHMANGFSTSMWLRTRAGTKSTVHANRNKNLHENQRGNGAEKSPRMEELSPPSTSHSAVHVISMGSKALMLQVWVDFSSGTFQFRVCLDPNDETKACLLAQAESPAGLLAPDRWQHLAFTYTQHAESKRTVQGKLELWVCGVRKCEIFLDYMLPRRSGLSSDSDKTCCMLGHRLHPAEDQSGLGSSCDLGNLLLFNGSTIGSEEAFYLYANGPDCTSIMPCKYGKQCIRLSMYLTEKVLKADQILEMFINNKEVDFSSLAESLGVVYSPSCPESYTIYEPIIQLKGLPKVVYTQRPYSTKKVQSPVLEPQFLSTIKFFKSQTLNSVFHHIGGTGCFIFLFARVVELSECERTQALALKILLTLVRYNQHRIQEMESCHGYAMIHQVLVKSRCIMGYHMLKVLLDGCCSVPVLVVGENGQFSLVAESTAIVRDLQLFSEVMLDWKVWSKAQAKVWATLVTALEILIRPHHPQKMFNIGQLLKAQVVQHFLLTFQMLQKHQDENLVFIPQDVCLSFLRITEEVLGSPPDLELLRIIYNFLLAVHPDNCTLVCHTPAGFYFSLHIVPCGEAQPVQSQNEGYYSKLPPSQGAVEESPRTELGSVGSTANLRNTATEQLLSSCKSARAMCDSVPHRPTREKPHEKVLSRPETLSGIWPLQRSQSKIANLYLAFSLQDSLLGCKSNLSDHSRLLEHNENFSFFSEFDSRDSKTGPTTDRHSTGDCLILVSCGLYELLRGVLLILPDLMLEEVVDKLIQPEALVVLLNHPSSFVQEAVMKLVDVYFSRAFKERNYRFLKNHGFSLLTNQLYRHQGTQGLLQCCLAMIFGQPVTLEQELDRKDLEKISSFRRYCVIPLLGLIEGSLSDTALVHRVMCTLIWLFNASCKMADILLNHGLLYSLLNTIAALTGLQHRIFLDDHKVLMGDIQQLLVLVTIHSCSTAGQQYFCIIEDIITLLSHLQTSNALSTQEIAVVLQLHVLHSAIKFIKATASWKRNFPTGVSSSEMLSMTQEHILHQQHRNSAGDCQWISPTQSKLLMLSSVGAEELILRTQRRLSEESPLQADEGELTQRLQKLVVMAIDRLVYLGITEDIINLVNIVQSTVQPSPVDIPVEPPVEENSSSNTLGSMGSFQKEIFKLLIEGIKIGLGNTGRSIAPRQPLQRILWSCRDMFRVQLSRLLIHMLSPKQPLEYRRRALEFVYECSHPDIVRECVFSSSECGPKLALYLQELLYDHKDELTEEDQMACTVFVTCLKLCGYHCTLSKSEMVKALTKDRMKHELEEKASKIAWEKKNETVKKSLIQRLDSKLKEVFKTAVDMTQAVSKCQDTEKKKLIRHIASLYKADLAAKYHWQQLIQQLTHARAPWFDQASHPTSWQLDPTEGPNRERRRLQRCYLTIANKYLLKEHRKPQELVNPPLSFIIEDRVHSSSPTSGQIKFAWKCISICPSRETSGDLLLGDSGMYFVEDSAPNGFDNNSPHGEMEPLSFSWKYEEIKEVHKRWWQLRDNAMEVFLTNGRTLLLAFDNIKYRNDVYQNILSSNLPNLLECGNFSGLTHLWSLGQITNFEYLAHLNKHAGRSFNDLMQYPVFPFILSDYTSETLDLHDPTIYRNLCKPIAVQSKEKEDRYVYNYKYLEEEFCKDVHKDDPMPPVQPYHYGSHYSNSGTVLHFLVRMPPFTKMFLSYQDQSFDIPDRTFHCMNTTWQLSSYDSMTDVKELIPEFFYLPEFLVNREGFDFGLRQNSERVNHVTLPPWARSDPRLFVLVHRQALESDFVSQTLCHWIDLVFGVKQKGKAAVQAVNVFHPATYFGIDVSAVEDPVQRHALETMIKTYGQTPRQLFNAPHVGRTTPKLLTEGELPTPMGLLVHLAFRESRDQIKEEACPSPLPWVKGLKWGEYVGSLSAPEPVVCFSQPHGEHFGALQALPTGAICGLSCRVCLMMVFSKEQGIRNMHSTDIKWSAIISWGHADNTLRLKSKQNEPPVSFIQCCQLYQVTSCAWVPDSCQLFTGSKCGVITAYSTRFTCGTQPDIEVESHVHLYGHTEEVTGLFVCKPFSIIISMSKDGTCILWDLNRLCYVQSLTGHKSPVMAVSASETTGDIASACSSVGGGSDLRLWTVNGDLIGHVHCREMIYSIAFSNQPEGVSVNVIAGGLENGVVRLWSTWDLKPVRDITFPKSNRPIVSVTYSCDGHHLYTVNSDSMVIAWCRRDQQRMKQPMFHSFLSSYAVG